MRSRRCASSSWCTWLPAPEAWQNPEEEASCRHSIAYKELTIRFEKFKTDIEGTTSESVTSISIQRMWENKAEWICQKTLNLANKFMEEQSKGASKRAS